MKIIKNEQTEKDLFEALAYVNIGELPKKFDGRSKKIWTKALIELPKKNGVMTYIVAHNIDDESIKVKKTFGETSQISLDKESMTIYPYEFLNMDTVPDKEDAEKFLKRYSDLPEEELSILDAPQKGKLLKEVSIKVQNSKKH